MAVSSASQGSRDASLSQGADHCQLITPPSCGYSLHVVFHRPFETLTTIVCFMTDSNVTDIDNVMNNIEAGCQVEVSYLTVQAVLRLPSIEVMREVTPEFMSCLYFSAQRIGLPQDACVHTMRFQG